MKYKKELQKKINIARKNYYLNKFENCRGDSSSTWKLTNNILGRKNKSKTPHTLTQDDDEITDKNEICNIFNRYFVNVGQNLADAIPNNNLDPLNYLG